MAKELVTINTEKALTNKRAPQFQVAVKNIPNPHKAQLFLDYGETPGPWVVIGIGNTAYGFGYLPPKKKPRPTQKKVVAQTENPA
jgi:hypothetical protein